MPVLAHCLHRDAVGQAGFLVRPSFVECQAILEPLAGLQADMVIDRNRQECVHLQDGGASHVGGGLATKGGQELRSTTSSVVTISVRWSVWLNTNCRRRATGHVDGKERSSERTANTLLIRLAASACRRRNGRALRDVGLRNFPKCTWGRSPRSPGTPPRSACVTGRAGRPPMGFPVSALLHDGRREGGGIGHGIVELGEAATVDGSEDRAFQICG